jgi:hypothetical protein
MPNQGPKKFTSLQVSPEIYQEFQSKVGPKKVSETIQTLMDRFNRGDGPAVGPSPLEERDLAAMLAAYVIADLRQNNDWARRVARKAYVRLPVGEILRERIQHYMLEKVYLGERFAAWLAKRIRYILRSGEDCQIYMDAGSAVLWLSRHLWPVLEDIAKESSWGSSGPRTVLLVTHSLPVAEGYQVQCESGHFSDRSPTPILCELLGGMVQSRYAALTGTTATRRLESLVESHDEPRYRRIAILAANYIRLFDGEGISAQPTPLIRGVGQRDIKQLYVKADEAYIMGCCGKLYCGTTESLNSVLGLPADDLYHDVTIDQEKTRTVKLVTTVRRTPEAILGPHSTRVLGLLGLPFDPPEPKFDGDINNMTDFCYIYDESVKGKDRKEQEEIEFPHERTRVKTFLEHYGL